MAKQKTFTKRILFSLKMKILIKQNKIKLITFKLIAKIELILVNQMIFYNFLLSFSIKFNLFINFYQKNNQIEIRKCFF